MILLEKLSFDFRAADEPFARDLYADWDRFCRRCVVDELDAFFSRYDDPEHCIEIDRLELELGGIPEPEFCEAFPLRLREALERTVRRPLQALSERTGRSDRPCSPVRADAPDRLGAPDPPCSPKRSGGTALSRFPDRPRFPALPCFPGRPGSEARPGDPEPRCVSMPARERRLENLLHYLEYGFCLPEWEGIGLDPEEELAHLESRKAFERLLEPIARNPNALERLFIRAREGLLTKLLAVLLSSSLSGQAGKRHFLAAVLERRPGALLRFIHGTKEAGALDVLAALLEQAAIRRVMTAETELHAEIGLPEYWYRLYEWLLAYYPFNGVPMFGDKPHFRLHLNRSLLAFIRRRSYPSYLSRAELTERFLVEVFGAEHTPAVLTAIYRNQRLNPDGTPASGDDHVRELYELLLRLSLLQRTPPADAGSGPKQEGGAGTELLREGAVRTGWPGTRPAADGLSEEPPAGAGSTQEYPAADGLPEKRPAGAGSKPEGAAGPERPAGAGDRVAAFEKRLSAGMREDAEAGLLGELAQLLRSPEIDDTRKSDLLRHCARWHPALLQKCIRASSAADGAGGTDGGVPFRRWSEWLGAEGSLELVAGLSLSLGVRLRRTNAFLAERYAVPEAALAELSIRFAADLPMERRSEGELVELLRRYVAAAERIVGGGDRPADAPALSTVKRRDETEAEENDRKDIGESAPVDPDLRPAPTVPVDPPSNRAPEQCPAIRPSQPPMPLRPPCPSRPSPPRPSLLQQLAAVLRFDRIGAEVQPDFIDVPNAGLCLLALWLPQLFERVGLLAAGAGGKRDLKGTGARIRAIFLLQRLATDERREYRERELAFNRLLAGCPFQVPLPKALDLTETERQTAAAMLAGVKANWDKLKNTSVKGFQRSFIERPGRLEQRERQWVLYVEERPYDLLLDALPWSYRWVRLPWLKKSIQVVWRDKETADFENR